MTTSAYYLTTLDEATMDDTCGMRLWYHKYEQGRGITANKDIFPQEMIEATFSDLKMIAEMEDISISAIQDMIDDILSKLTPADRTDLRAMEVLYRRLGWMAAYALFIEPSIRKLYLTTAVDDHLDMDRDPLWIRVRTGRVMRHRSGNAAAELEHRVFVPTSAISAKWRDGWQHNILPHLSAVAVREALNRPVPFARVMGINLGVQPSTPNSALHHPYVYAWKNKVTGEWTHQFKMSSEPNWQELPVWECPLNLTQWVLKCGPTTADLQFPLSDRFVINSGMVEQWCSRQLRRQREIAEHRVASKDNKFWRAMVFPQVTSQCTPVCAAPCAYKDLCWTTPLMSQALQNTQFTINLPLLLRSREELERTMVMRREDFLPRLPKKQPPLLLTSGVQEKKTLSQLCEESMTIADADASAIIEGEVISSVSVEPSTTEPLHVAQRRVRNLTLHRLPTDAYDPFNSAPFTPVL